MKKSIKKVTLLFGKKNKLGKEVTPFGHSIDSMGGIIDFHLLGNNMSLDSVIRSIIIHGHGVYLAKHIVGRTDSVRELVKKKIIGHLTYIVNRDNNWILKLRNVYGDESVRISKLISSEYGKVLEGWKERAKVIDYSSLC